MLPVLAYLWVAFLLEVGDNTLTDKVGSPDDVQNLLVIPAHERQLEAVFGRVDRDDTRLCVPI